MASWRTEAVERLAEMSGTDVNGALLPPPEGVEINREPMTWWRPGSADAIVRLDRESRNG